MIRTSFSRGISFAENINLMAKKLQFPQEDDGVVNYQIENDFCKMRGFRLNEDIEMGYFNFKLSKACYVITPEESGNDIISINFSFGDAYEYSVSDNQGVTVEGFTNSIIISNLRIRTTTNIRKGENFHALSIRFNKRLLKELFRDVRSFNENTLEVHTPLIQFADISPMVLNALRSLELYKLPISTSRPYLIGKSFVLASLVVDILENRNKKRPLNMSAEEYAGLLAIRKYIIKDWKNPPTIQQVSVQLGMSPTKAKLLFKQLFGIPIYSYFNQKRLERAFKLVNDGGMSIAEIGQDLGYKNMSHFSEAFKKKYGILPKRLSQSISNRS